MMRLKPAELSGASFGRSWALFDRAGKLVDWDAGFASEFSMVRIAAGAPFREILQAALEHDQVVRIDITEPERPEKVRSRIGRWPHELGQENSFEYRDGERIVHVRESRTVSGRIIRAAREAAWQGLSANGRGFGLDGDGVSSAGWAAADLRKLACPATLRDADGSLVLRSHSERELIRARAASPVVGRTESEFLSRISHEIRTPMNVVLGMAELLAETELSAEQRRYLELMTANGNALMERIGRTFERSRIESGGLKFEQAGGVSSARSGPAAKAVAPSVETVLNLAGYRVLVVDDVEVNRLIVREMLWESGAEVSEAESGVAALAVIREAAEAGRPYGIVLLDMKMPGMDGSDVAARLRHEWLPQRPVVLMLSSDDLRPQSTSLKDLGLHAFLVKPIARKELLKAIARLVGNTTNEAGVTLPELPAPEVPREQRASESREQAAIGAGLRILVAEDSADNRLLVHAYLRRESHQVDFAENGQIAVEKFRSGEYDLVLMDIQMPELDGLGATQMIRQWENEQGRTATPIIALTASSALEDDVRRILEAGCDMHVSKPVKKSVLLEAVRDAAGLRGRASGAACVTEATIAVAPQPDAIAGDGDGSGASDGLSFGPPVHGQASG